MSVPQPKLSEVIDVRTAGPASPGAPSSTLAKTATLEVRRLTLPKGREIPTHHARGEITVHCLEGGSLEIELRTPHQGWVELRVSDSGPGIAPSLLSRVFEPFVSSKESGLGLTVSRRIAEDHGGSLVASTRPEGGACFVLRLAAPPDETREILETPRGVSPCPPCW